MLFYNVNLKIDKPGIYSFIGDNGSGKSTLLNIIGGYIKPSKGKVKCKENNVSFMSQNVNLLENLTIKDTFRMLGLNINLLRKVGLFSKKDKYPRELSLGMKQRIALLISLYSKSTIIILDEPTSHLDFKNSKVVMREVKKISKNKIVLLVSHNLNMVEEYSDFIYRLNDKKINLIKSCVVKKDLLLDKTKRNKKFNIYYRKGIMKNKRANFLFFIIVFLLFLMEFMIACLRINMSNYLILKEYSSLDYNKFYLRECSKLKTGKIIIKKCDNISEQKVEMLKSKYNVVINYDVIFNDLYNVNNLSFIHGKEFKLKEGEYPSRYNEVIASSNYSIGDQIALDTIKVISYDKTDIYKNKLILNVVGICESKPFINDNNIYLDYLYMENYLKEERLINNDISLYDYFKDLDMSGYKYVLYFDDINIDIFDKLDIDYLSASYEYYESLKDSFNDIIKYIDYVNISMLGMFIYYIFRLIKKRGTLKQNDIVFLKTADINKREIVKLINKENVFIIYFAFFISLCCCLLLFDNIPYIFFIVLLIVVLFTNRFLMKREIERRVRI